jgi:hypothetical protein
VNNRTEARNRVEHYSRTGGTGAGAQGGRGNWQHNPEHRRGAQYRDTATQQRFNKTGPANAQAREQFRGRTQQGGDFSRGAAQRQGGLGQQPSASIGERGGQAAARGGQLGQGGGAQARQGAAQARPSGGGQVRQAGGFEGVGGGGRDAQSFSNRGNASRESFNRSAGASRPSGGGAAAARGGGGGGGARAGGGGGRGGGGRR